MTLLIPVVLSAIVIIAAMVLYRFRPKESFPGSVDMIGFVVAVFYSIITSVIILLIWILFGVFIVFT